jgi:hypothetical protein
MFRPHRLPLADPAADGLLTGLGGPPPEDLGHPDLGSSTGRLGVEAGPNLEAWEAGGDSRPAPQAPPSLRAVAAPSLVAQDERQPLLPA